MPYRLNPLRRGWWLGWLMHDVCSPDEDMPSRRRLRFTVRQAVSTQADASRSGHLRPGMTPSLEVQLIRIDATTWAGRTFTLWRTEALVYLLAGVQRVVLREDRGFTHEETAREHFLDLCTMTDQLCDPPADDWRDPAPWRRSTPIPVGSATAWCEPADPDDQSDLFWLNALGVEVMVRRRNDGTFIHVDSEALPRAHRPVLIEVDASGTTEYGEGPSDD